MEESASKAVKFDFPEEYKGHTTYREAPFHIRGAFIEHVKETHTPETFPGLYWGRLNKDEPFEILHTFAVDRKKRPEGDYIPCPMCQRREKFLEGSFVFIFKRQCIAVIGHDCASAEVKHAAFSKKKQDDQRRQQEDFLLAKLGKVPGVLREIRLLMNVADQIEDIYHDLKRDAPKVQRALRQVRKYGGEYVLYEFVENEAAKYDERLPKKTAIPHYFGMLAGDALVASSCKFVADLRRFEVVLLAFDGCDSEEKAMEATIGLLERREAAKAVLYIGEARRKLPKLRDEMVAACSFFEGVHVDNMRSWATHPLQQTPFTVERQVRHDGIALTIAGRVTDEDREYARLLLPHSLADWADENRRFPAFEGF